MDYCISVRLSIDNLYNMRHLHIALLFSDINMCSFFCIRTISGKPLSANNIIVTAFPSSETPKHVLYQYIGASLHVSIVTAPTIHWYFLQTRSTMVFINNLWFI